MAAKHSAGYSVKMRARRRWTIVLVISLVVLLGSLGALGAIAFSYWQGQQAYDRVDSLASLRDETNGIGIDAPDASFDLAALTVDWAALSQVNSDLVAWIYIPGTRVDYPVVRGADDEYYLDHDFERTQGALTNNGCIFMKASNSRDFSDRGTFLFGHNLNDGSMFAVLSDESAFAGGRDIYVLTPHANMRLRPFALVHCSSDEPLAQTHFSSQADFGDYVADKIGRSVVDVGASADPSSIDRFIALVTCDNLFTDGRYALFCYVEEVAAR